MELNHPQEWGLPSDNKLPEAKKGPVLHMHRTPAKHRLFSHIPQHYYWQKLHMSSEAPQVTNIKHKSTPNELWISLNICEIFVCLIFFLSCLCGMMLLILYEKQCLEDPSWYPDLQRWKSRAPDIHGTLASVTALSWRPDFLQVHFFWSSLHWVHEGPHFLDTRVQEVSGCHLTGAELRAKVPKPLLKMLVSFMRPGEKS